MNVEELLNAEDDIWSVRLAQGNVEDHESLANRADPTFTDHGGGKRNDESIGRPSSPKLLRSASQITLRGEANGNAAVFLHNDEHPDCPVKIVDGRVGKLVVEVSSDLMEDLLSPWWIVKSTVQDRSRLQKDTKCTEFLQTQGSDENGVAFKIDNKKWPVRQVGILFQVTLVAYIDGHVADVASSGLFAYHGSGERGKSKPKSSEPADGGKKKRKGKPSVGEWVMEAYNAVNVNILEILWRDIDAFSRGAGGGGGGGGSGFVVSLKEKHDKLHLDLQFIYGYLPEFGERAQRDGWWFGEVDVSGRMETVKRLVRGTSSEDPTVRRIFGLPFAFQEVDGTWRVYWGLVTYNAELKMYLQRDMGLQPRKQNRVSFLKSTEWLAMNLLYKLETGDYVLYGNILLSLPGEAQSSGLRPESKERIDSSVLEDRVKLLSVSDDKVVVQARAVIVKMLGDEHIRGDFLLLDGFVTAARHARMLSNVHTNNGGDRANDETICRIEWTSHFGQLWRYKMVEEPHYINLTKRALDSLTANESREEVGSEVMDAFVILLRNKQSASDKRCFLSSIFWTALKEYTAQDLPDVIEFARGIFESSIWFDKTEFIMPLRFVKSDGGGVYWVVAWVQMQDKELHIFNTNIANYQVEMIYADCLCNFFSSFVALQDCQQGLSDFQPDNNFIGSRVGLTSWNVVIDAPCNQQEEDSCSSGVLSMGHIWEIFNERAIHDRVSSANLRREFGEMIQNAASSETSMLLWPPLEGFD